MPRNPELEALLQAQYDLEGAAPHEKEARLRDQRKLFDQCLERYNARARKEGKRGISPQELMEALGGPYQEFKKAKDLQMREMLRRRLN